MSLLQNPLASVDQIEWYLDHRDLERFPGAFLIAAGNLSRQLLEQILFILAFYGGLPRPKYMTTRYRLKEANAILVALKQTNPTSGLTYLEQARRRGPRIRKFARFPRTLNLWRRQFNEPSHFRNPVSPPQLSDEKVRQFAARMRGTLDSADHYLVTAAVNEIVSKGRVRAILGSDKDNKPGVWVQSVVRPEDFSLENGRLVMTTSQFPLRIVPANEEVPLGWRKAVLVVQGTRGMTLNSQIVTEIGEPINLGSLEATLVSLARVPRGRFRLRRRLKALGYTLDFSDEVEGRSTSQSPPPP